MLISITLMILIVLVIFSLILGATFIDVSEGIGVDNTSLINGTLTTYEVPTQDVIFGIDPLIGGIAIIIALGITVSLIGAQVLSTGLSPSSVRTLTIIAGYSALWILLSVMVSGLIKSIEIFGGIIYIILTLGYTVGVIQKISGGSND